MDNKERFEQLFGKKDEPGCTCPVCVAVKELPVDDNERRSLLNAIRESLFEMIQRAILVNKLLPGTASKELIIATLRLELIIIENLNLEGIIPERREP